MTGYQMVEKSSAIEEHLMQTLGSPVELVAGQGTYHLVLDWGIRDQEIDRQGSDSSLFDVLVLLLLFPDWELDPYLRCLLSTLPSSAFHLCMASCRRIFRMVAGRLWVGERI